MRETLFQLLTRLGACEARFRYVGLEYDSGTYTKAKTSHITWLVGALGTASDRAWLRRYWQRHTTRPVRPDWWKGTREDRLASYYLVGSELEYPIDHEDRVDGDIRERFPYEYVLKLVQNA